MLGIYISTIVLAAILGIVMYFVNAKLAKNKIISFVLTILTMYLLKPYICARAQLVTFILFLLTIYFIEKFLETKKIRAFDMYIWNESYINNSFDKVRDQYKRYWISDKGERNQTEVLFQGKLQLFSI